MKKLFLFLTVCAVSLCASASNKYVSPTGDDSKDGSSWANARATIAACIWSVGSGDTMFIAEGVYHEAISAQSGCTYMGGFNAETGDRDPEMYESILDGTGMTSWLLVKYDNDPEARIVIDGLVFQNANHSEWGGAAMFISLSETVSRLLPLAKYSRIRTSCRFRNYHQIVCGLTQVHSMQF